jgi:membrane-associated phospholipid phosphatase
MHFITDFADLAVLLPLAIYVGLGFAWLGWRHGARAWAIAVTAALATMLALKFCFLGCANGIPFSPSGHTAAGTVIYGGLAAFWLRQWIGPPTAAALSIAVIAPLLGASRLALHVHSPAEVSLGALVGATCVVLLLRLAGPIPRDLRPTPLVAAGLLLALVLHGIRLPVEEHLRAVYGWLPGSVCAALGFQ